MLQFYNRNKENQIQISKRFSNIDIHRCMSGKTILDNAHSQKLCNDIVVMNINLINLFYSCKCGIIEPY